MDGIQRELASNWSMCCYEDRHKVAHFNDRGKLCFAAAGEEMKKKKKKYKQICSPGTGSKQKAAHWILIAAN